MATKVGIREARMHLSRYLRMVKTGGEVILTERGKPVCKLVPLGREELSLADRIARLEAAGLIEPAKPVSPLPPPIVLPGVDVQAYLQEDRAG